MNENLLFLQRKIKYNNSKKKVMKDMKNNTIVSDNSQDIQYDNSKNSKNKQKTKCIPCSQKHEHNLKLIEKQNNLFK